MRDDYTDMTVVLDRSGSMAAIADDTIGGFNKFVEEQRKVTGEARLTLAQFDDHYEIVYQGKPIAEVPSLDLQPRGWTKLLDAVGKTIVATGERLAAMPEADRPGKVIFVIITDGHENSSTEWTRDKVFAEIKKQTDVFKWQFVFLGANQDAIAVGAQMGISVNNSMTFAANAVGTRSSYDSLTSNVTKLRSGQAKSMAFSDEDRKKQQAAMNS